MIVYTNKYYLSIAFSKNLHGILNKIINVKPAFCTNRSKLETKYIFLLTYNIRGAPV